MQDPNHQKAQEMASEAGLLKAKDPRRSEALYRSAADHERRALSRLSKDAVRTRGILAVSLVSMLYKARDYAKAESSIFGFLGDDSLLPTARSDLQRLLEVVWDEKLIAEAGSQYSGDELLVSLRGGRVGYGTAPLDVVLHNISGFNSLLYRVSEWLGKFNFRLRGLPPAEVLQAVQARVTQPVPGSYRFTVRLVAPRQLELPFGPPAIVPRQISTSILKVIELASTGASEEMKKYVPDPQYRDAMLKLIRNIVPAGRSVEEVELARLGGDTAQERSGPIVLVPGTRTNVARVIESSATKRPIERVTERGTLRALHLDRNWLEISRDDGESLRFETEGNVLDDVVGPMVNRRVVVRAHREGRLSAMLRLDDIELDVSAENEPS